MLLPAVTRRAARAPRSAFTLLEILVVVAIIVMLAGVGSYYIMQRYEDAKLSTAKIGVMRIDSAVGSYKLNYSQWPDNLQVLTQHGENGGPYLKEDELKDPWNQAYQYDPSCTNNGGIKPDISTKAPTGKIIGNWESPK